MHLRPRLRPAHGHLPTRVRGRRAVVEDLGVRPPDGGQAAADDARPRPPEHAGKGTRDACAAERSNACADNCGGNTDVTHADDAL